MTIFPREQVAQHLAVSVTVLTRYETLGLVHAVRKEGVEGYEPSEVRKLWTVVSLQRDLGINLAGVEAVLRLRSHIDEVHHQLDRLAIELREALNDQGGEP